METVSAIAGGGFQAKSRITDIVVQWSYGDAPVAAYRHRCNQIH